MLRLAQLYCNARTACNLLERIGSNCIKFHHNHKGTVVLADLPFAVSALHVHLMHAMFLDLHHFF